ncbi:MAG: hypothetical protein RQ754_04950 [Desulfuromonadales bacterium]|nr:hypothetical protein [Desulfuromonadales bacterium]
MRKNLGRNHAERGCIALDEESVLRSCCRATILVFCSLAVAAALSGCGGSSSGEHVVNGFDDYRLSITGPETQSSADPDYQHWLSDEGWYLEGDGFLPPGTTCLRRTCLDSDGFIESAWIGEHELTWVNETTGASGIISQGSKFESSLWWACYCDTPPQWSAWVPIVPGLNRIVVTQRAGGLVQQDAVDVTWE